MSCFKLDNQSNRACKIVCEGNMICTLNVEAAGNSQGSTQFDVSLNDSLGYPSPASLYCEISFTGGESHRFNFNNPFYGPVIEFNALSEKELTVHVREIWAGKAQAHYKFNW